MPPHLTPWQPRMLGHELRRLLVNPHRRLTNHCEGPHDGILELQETIAVQELPQGGTMRGGCFRGSHGGLRSSDAWRPSPVYILIKYIINTEVTVDRDVLHSFSKSGYCREDSAPRLDSNHRSGRMVGADRPANAARPGLDAR